MNIEESKRVFIHNEIISSAINAAFQRGNVYRGNKDSANKAEKEKYDRTCNKFRKNLKDDFVRDSFVDINDIEEFLKTLCNRITREYGDKNILEDNEFRIGTAQKLVNLYLKYRWCLGWSPKPPHCPFDRQVIEYLQNHVHDELKLKIAGITWTKIGDREKGGMPQGIKDYQNLVKAAKEVSDNEGYESIADWELELWNKNYI